VTTFERTVLVMNAPPIAHEHSPVRDGNDIVERGDPILKRHDFSPITISGEEHQ